MASQSYVVFAVSKTTLTHRAMGIEKGAVSGRNRSQGIETWQAMAAGPDKTVTPPLDVAATNLPPSFEDAECKPAGNISGR